MLIVSQVTTARCVCGTWRARRASRSSRLTGRSSTSPSTTWRSTPPSATSAAREPTPSPKSSYDLRPPTKTASTNSCAVRPEHGPRTGQEGRGRDDPGRPGCSRGSQRTRRNARGSSKHLLLHPHRKLGAAHTSPRVSLLLRPSLVFPSCVRSFLTTCLLLQHADPL